MITAIIVENEQKHAGHLKELLTRHFPEIVIRAICETIPDAEEQVSRLRPDLVLLDVELPPYTGFDLLEKTSGFGYKVIFITSHNQYAVRAIKFSALHYILKPFGADDLKEAIDRFKRGTQGGSQQQQIQSLLRNLKQSEIDELEIYIPIRNGQHRLKLGNIISCMAQDGKTSFYVKGEEPLAVSKTLSWAEDMLTDYRFFRTSDAYLINLSHVEKIENVREGAVVTLTEGYEAEVSKRKKAKFLNVILQANILKIK